MKTLAQLVTEKIIKLQSVHARLDQSITKVDEARLAIQSFGRDGQEYQQRYAAIETFIKDNRVQLSRRQRAALDALQPNSAIENKITLLLQRANAVLSQLKEQKNRSVQKEGPLPLAISSTAMMLQQLDCPTTAASRSESPLEATLSITVASYEETADSAEQYPEMPLASNRASQPAEEELGWINLEDDVEWVDSDEENEYSKMLCS